MGKVLLNISILNKNYCIFEREKGSKLNASFYDKKAKVFSFVTSEKELKILNEVIRQLNKKYVRRRDVIFNDETFIRYVNRYTGMSYFAKMEDGSPESCSYLDYKELYNNYNCKQIFCARRNHKNDSDDDFYDYDIFSESSSYDDYFEEPIHRRNYKGKQTGLVKKIIVSICGVSVVVALALGGYHVLSTGNLPDIESAEPIIEELESAETKSSDYDTVPDTDEEQALKDKYDNIADQLKAAGLENWEIAIQLDLISIFDEDKENISFYYDNQKDEIVYIYDDVQKVDEVKTSEAPQISADIQRVIDTINENTRLSQVEKEHIISTYTPIWCKNERYLNIYELINRYSVLETEFDYTEGGKFLEDTQSYNPYEKAAGVYVHRGFLAMDESDLGTCYESKIIIYDADSFEDVLQSEDALSTFDHENNHVNGSFGNYSAILLNEGYNQLSQANRQHRYNTEEAMAMLFIETFGDEALREGFYGFDLQTVLTNKIVHLTNRNPIEVDSEINELIEDVEDVLYASGKDPNFRENSEILEQYEDIFRRLGVYHELITGREMEDNQSANIIEDFITGSRRSSVYGKDTESIGSTELDYDLDTGTLTVEIHAKHGEVPYRVSNIETRIGEGVSKRRVVLNDTNKYDREYPINDKDIGYLSR